MPAGRATALLALLAAGSLIIALVAGYRHRGELFGTTEEWTNSAGASAWLRTAGLLRGPSAGFRSAAGRRSSCPIVANGVTISPDGLDAFADTDEGVFDFNSCARFGSVAAFVGGGRVWVEGQDVIRGGLVVVEAPDPWLMPALDGALISAGPRGDRYWVGMLGEHGIVAFTANDLAVQRKASRLLERRGGMCVHEQLGWPLGNRLGPRESRYQCWRFSDGKRFVFAGFPVDVDLELSGRRFLDAETGQEVGFPAWGGDMLPYGDSDYCVTPLIVYPDGTVRPPNGCS